MARAPISTLLIYIMNPTSAKLGRSTAYSDGRLIYLDNAAATAPADDVLAAMLGAARDLYANPASAHAAGAAAARALAGARAEVAAALDVEPAELLFTSGGTEADALGVLGAARAARGRHLVVSALEHPAVMRAVDALAAEGYTSTTSRRRPTGMLRADDVAAAVRPETALVAVMLVNNELGTLQPVAEVARRLAALPRGRRPHLHVDAVQAFGLLRLRPQALGADTLALSAHKLHGPRGAGALWVRPGARRRRRSGSAAARSGRSAAAPRTSRRWSASAAPPPWRQLALDAGAGEAVAGCAIAFETAALAAARAIVPAARAHGDRGAARAPHIASLAFPGLPAEPLLHALEARGVLASAGSACASRTAGPSPALKAIGVDDRTGVLRFSLSRDTTARRARRRGHGPGRRGGRDRRRLTGYFSQGSRTPALRAGAAIRGPGVSSVIRPSVPLRKSLSSAVAARAVSGAPPFFTRLRPVAINASSPCSSQPAGSAPNRCASSAG